MKTVQGYEGLYAIDDDLLLYSFYNNRWGNGDKSLVKGWVGKNGYRYVMLCKDGIQKEHLFHRVVASVFHPNPNNYPVVRHLDNNPLNNHPDNLEWCTQKTNMRQAHNEGRIPRTEAGRLACIANGKLSRKPVMQLTKEGILCRIYESCREAATITKFHHPTICACAKGNGINKTCGGYLWQYVTL